MPVEPRWLTVDYLIGLNAAIVDETGEPHALSRPALLESAQAKPVNHWHYGEADLARLAVHLCFGIARNHPFIQGNKRTAFAAMDQFLNLNGYVLDLPDTEFAAALLIEVLEGRRSEDDLVQAVASNVKASASH